MTLIWRGLADDADVADDLGVWLEDDRWRVLDDDGVADDLELMVSCLGCLARPPLTAGEEAGAELSRLFSCDGWNEIMECRG